MFRILATTSLALLMTGCGPSRNPIAPLRLPAPPSEALQPCTIPPLLGGSAEAVELALIERGAAIKTCEARRAALVQAWPRD